MITKSTRNIPVRKRPITASTAINSRPLVRQNARPNLSSVTSATKLNADQQKFLSQLRMNVRKQSAITAATNTTNIAARPDFMEMLPLFVQKLHILDVYGSVAMRSRQQLIPYFKFVAENTKGQTAAGSILSSPFANRQGIDPNFTGRLIKGETVTLNAAKTNGVIAYTPIIPGSVQLDIDGTLVDDYTTPGQFGGVATLNYATGELVLTTAATGTTISATYQYDNENVGPNVATGFGHEYGAKMAKGYLQLDEINLIAEAHELACYWSVYSAFAAQQEYGSNIGDIAKEAAISEITAEINTSGFNKLAQASTYAPQFNWDASAVLSGAVVPSDYLNMFKLRLNQAAASIYQATRLSTPNRLIVGSNVGSYIGMMNGFVADNATDNVGPYHLGRLDNFEIYVNPDYDPDLWVMCCKSNDIRRNSALFGEYMPITSTDALGMANASVQQGYAAMHSLEIINPATIVSGKILGTF